MKVGQRLFIAVLPAVLGCVLVAALAYWGQYARTVPATALLVAGVAAAVSLVVSWVNTRHVAHRIERLARRHGEPRDDNDASTTRPRADGSARRESAESDELDEIASRVEGLSSLVAGERVAAERRIAGAEARVAEYAGLLAQAVQYVGERVNEVQLPLHILLASPFGELNENQEELLGAARDAAEAADAELRLLGRLVATDEEHGEGTSERIGVGTLLESPLAIARARGARTTVRLHADLPDTLPRLVVGPARVQEALTALLAAAVGGAEPGAEVRLTAREPGPAKVELSIAPGPAPEDRSLPVLLASRVLDRQGACVERGPGHWTLTLPSERMGG